MTDGPTPQGRGWWRPAYHLIWAMPIVLIVSAHMAFMATLSLCGISGCSGAGFGRTTNPDVVSGVSLIIAAGVVAALPLGVVLWARRKSTRWLAAGVFAFIIWIATYTSIGF